jgi:hypothetical protein
MRSTLAGLDGTDQDNEVISTSTLPIAQLQDADMMDPSNPQQASSPLIPSEHRERLERLISWLQSPDRNTEESLSEISEFLGDWIRDTQRKLHGMEEPPVEFKPWKDVGEVPILSIIKLKHARPVVHRNTAPGSEDDSYAACCEAYTNYHHGIIIGNGDLNGTAVLGYGKAPQDLDKIPMQDREHMFILLGVNKRLADRTIAGFRGVLNAQGYPGTEMMVIDYRDLSHISGDDFVKVCSGELTSDSAKCFLEAVRDQLVKIRRQMRSCHRQLDSLE